MSVLLIAGFFATALLYASVGFGGGSTYSALLALYGFDYKLLPVLSLVGMFLVNPAFYLQTARDPIFIYGFTGLILLYVVGIAWLRRMIDLKV